MALDTYFERSARVDGVVIKGGRTLDGGSNLRYDETIPANSTNLVVAVAFNTTKLIGYHLQSNAAITLKFNSSGTPDPSVVLVAGQPEQWDDEMAGAKVFVNNVTTLYVTSGNTATRLQMLFNVDPT